MVQQHCAMHSTSWAPSPLPRSPLRRAQSSQWSTRECAEGRALLRERHCDAIHAAPRTSCCCGSRGTRRGRACFCGRLACVCDAFLGAAYRATEAA